MAEVVKFEWNGDKVAREVREKAARGVTEMARQAAEYAKDVVAVGDPFWPQYDKHPGLLQRSITIGAPGQSHALDESRALQGEDLLETAGVEVAVIGQARAAGRFTSGTEIKVEVGSWIAYACVEEVRQPYIYPGVELMRGEAVDIMIEAFREA